MAALLPVIGVGVVALWIADRIDSAVFRWSMRRSNGLAPVRSTVNGRVYDVAHGVEAANVLARAQGLAFQVLQELGRRLKAGAVPRELVSGVRRLLAAHPDEQSIVVAELNDYESNLIAFNRNKGEQIMLCVTDAEQVVREDTVLFVLLHELAHTATAGYDPLQNGRTVHSDDFFRYEHYLYAVATEMGIQRPREQQGKGLCGTYIAHPHPETLPV